MKWKHMHIRKASTTINSLKETVNENDEIKIAAIIVA